MPENIALLPYSRSYMLGFDDLVSLLVLFADHSLHVIQA